MDSKTGGLSSDDKRRLAAENLARQKVLMAYERKEVDVAANFIKKQEGAADSGREQSVKAAGLGASATPVLKNVSNEDWKKYHTAWQNYYQKYYSQYYMNAAKEYVAKQQVSSPVRTAILSENDEKKSQISHALESDKKQGSVSFKDKIRARAEERKKTASRRRKMMPILAGLVVMLTVLFLQYNRLVFAPIAAYVSPGESPAEEISAMDPTVTLTKVSADPKLIIPKLNIDVPLNFGVAIDDVMDAMNRGVAHYRINGASAYPGEVGNFVVMGHSAGDVYSANQYKFIFSGLERLEAGDLIYVHYNSVRYTYRMTGSEIILPTEVSKLVIETDKPIMTLVTCWPLGTSQKRLLIYAEQIAPSNNEAKQQEEIEEKVEEGSPLPENEETLFDRIRKWLNL
ncbi:class E sortase [Candidatus Saccharibacteria bacterium]|nr:class E sortase [Candidatus Saccharibacteria bacterium]